MRSPLYATILAVLLGIASADGDTIEPIGVQGPSSRGSVREPSAYQTRDQSTETPTPSEHGRRLNISGTAPARADASRPAADRGTAMLTSWAESSGVTALAALAFVVGLFMLLAWATKRSLPRSSQMLPAEAVRILGRVPLGSRQFGHLLQLGNKLVLVSINPTGVKKLAEIEDPQEVARLVTMCGKTSSKGSQKEFDEIFGQFAKDKPESGFLGSEASLFSRSHDADSTEGGRYA